MMTYLGLLSNTVNDLVIFVMIPLIQESSDQRSTKKEKIKRGKMRSIMTETFVQLDPWNRGREEPDCGPLPVQL